ncbi:hypothetical protein EDB81DRAFT_836293 [Dactylonectria macrodidyma]|uniref:DUF7580 domain-containing protein n=1 Tax=Dactylonectria macrodidyma TaxID=307937 RepID=A0A9P9FTG7_9HYPO|nr:hypothetical protein EDB81DRAFT_836293 [Dactylonectria macrodidyma]
MSGIEVAGLLLGALPILFAAVDLSKDGIQRGIISFRKRHFVEKLALALLLQQRTLAETVRSLLIGSGYEDVSGLHDDPVGYLSDKSVKNQLLDYLGPENTAAFTGALRQSDDIVKSKARNITGLVPAFRDPTDNLLAIVKSNQEVNGGWLDLIPRVKLVFRATELKTAIRDLDDTTTTLDRFARIILAAKLAKALRQVRGFANDLYLAIFQGWRAGCQDNHEARLFLEDRVDDATDILKHVRRDNSTPVFFFQLIFAASIYQGQAFRPSESPHITLVVPGSTSVRSEVTFVDDICAAIEAASCRKRQFAFVLTGNQQLGSIPRDERTVIPYHRADRIALKSLLCDDKSRHHSTLLPLRLRMLLALRLASNLLQLLQTQWLQSTWSKDMIFFLLRLTGDVNNTSRDHLHIDFGRPFVSLTFDDSNASALPQPNVDPKVALLELGILLLEIWHTWTLETQFSLKEALVEYYERLPLASK